MRRLLFALLALVCLSTNIRAQTPKDVPDSARREILRRGNHVEHTGYIRGGLIAAAFAPPADDSHKWFITLVGKPGEPVFDSMKAMIESGADDHLLAWIDAKSPQQSATVYHWRAIDDDLQRDWLSGLRDPIARFGLPAIVLQPPRSGQFGPPETIVKMIHGKKTARELADLLRDAVTTYVKTIENPIQVGIRSEQKDVGSPPPFNVPPPDRPATHPPLPSQNAQLPIDWPPAAPKELTIDQVKQACPGASPEFILGVVSSKETNLEIVKLKWMLFEQSHPQKVEEPPAPVESIVRVEPSESLNPFAPSSMIALTAMASLIVGCGVGWMVSVYRTKLAARNADILEGLAQLKRTREYQFAPDQGQIPHANQNMTGPSPTGAPTWKPPGPSANG